MLCNRKGLAMTSSKPGKTLLINHFLINDEWHLVDLPGYGYASTGKTMRDKLKGIIESYISNREQLTCLFLLVDSRLEAQKIDLDFMIWLGENGIPFAIVFTKMDKLSTSKTKENTENYKTKLLESWEELPPLFYTSSENKAGRDELLNYIEEINNAIAQG